MDAKLDQAVIGKEPEFVPTYIDVSSAVHAKAGIGRYAGSLARALLDMGPGRFALFYNRRRGSQLPPGLDHAPSRTVRAGYKPWRMAVWLGQLASISFDRLVPDADLFHATEHLLPPLAGIPTVLTVHDMIFRLFPEHQKRLNYWYLNATMPLYCRRAGAIITVSESSKRDIVEHYGIDSDKIAVIYEAASPEFVPGPATAIDQVRRQYSLPDHFLIHVGTIEPRKNLTRLVEALHHLRSEGLRIPLLVVGGKGWLSEGLYQKLEELEMRDAVHFSGYVPAPDLPLLYCAARAAVMPSVYEGFGLPVLEAMACGTPVASSNCSSLPEIGGQAAQFFDPYSVEEMAAVIGTIWTDSEMRAEMKQDGLAQAARFSWDRAAQETQKVYETVLDDHARVSLA